MLTLAASQADLTARDGAALVRLFHLTTYSDRDAGTVEAEHWFSQGTPARYRWAGGAARDFADLVVDCDELVLAADHLPDPSVAASRRSRATITLANDVLDGATLWATLSAQNLPFARLEIATLLVERTRFATGGAFWDLSDLAGTEHVVRFRGELSGIDGADDEAGIRLVFESEEPGVQWPELESSTDADPRDLGRRYSIPFGRAKGVPCVNRRVGWSTRLSDVISSTYTGNVKITSAAGLAGSFTLSLGAERVSATFVDATTVNVTARGQGGTVATAHQRGESVVEILSSVTIVVAGVPCAAVDALYVVDPSTREPVLVPSSLYSVNLDDVATDTARRLTTVTFTQANFEALLDSLGAAGSGANYEEIELNRFLIEAPGGNDWTDCVLNVDGLGIRLNGRAAVAAKEVALWKLDAAAIPESVTARGIVRLRAKALANGEGDTANGPTNQDAKTNLNGDALFPLWDAGPNNHNEALDYVFQAGSQESGVALASAWYTPGIAKTGADLADVEVRFDFDPPHATPNQYLSDNWAFLFAGSVVLEVEFAPARIESLGAAAFGLGLAFVADVQGVTVPESFELRYGFDEGTGWSVAGGTHTDLGTSQKLTADALSLIADTRGACDDHTLWTNTGGATLATETTIKTQGTGSLKITPNTAGNQAEAEANFTANADWTGKAIAIDLRPEGANHLKATTGVRVRFEDAGGDWRAWDLGTADGLVVGAFSTVIIDPKTGWDEDSGTFTITAIDRIRIVANKAPASGSTSNVLYADNIRLIELVTPAAAQRNATAAAVDLTAPFPPVYALRLRATNVAAISQVSVVFSNTAGAGTTLPAAYRAVRINGYELTEGQWLTVQRGPSDTGSPGINNVETVRIEIKRGAGSVATPTVELDSISVALATNADWDGAAPGTLLELGPDAIRYFVGELARQGAANVLGVPTAKTNLGGVVFAGTFDSLGSSFAEVLERLAFETRTNVLSIPTSSGRVFKLSNANTSSAFPSSSLTLSEFRGLRESARPALVTPSSFRCHYAASLVDGDALGRDERAFRALLSASSLSSDVPAKASTSALAAIAAKVGARPADALFLAFSQAQATAVDVFGYYVAESIRTPARRWTLRVPYAEGYALEPFDVVAFRPRWLVADVKARVVGIKFSLVSPSIELSCVEVL